MTQREEAEQIIAEAVDQLAALMWSTGAVCFVAGFLVACVLMGWAVRRWQTKEADNWAIYRVSQLMREWESERA